jgi:peptidoglycan hydrolase CwlO-like protein
MDIKETIAAALKEIIFPELQELKRDMRDLKSGQAALNTRLNDHNAHLMDQSRRLDQMRSELVEEIHQVRTELKAEIHQVRTELKAEIHQVRTELKAEIHQVRNELKAEIHQGRAELNSRIDHLLSELEATNRNIAHLYEVIVRRDDYQQLQERVARIENQVAELRQKVAA